MNLMSINLPSIFTFLKPYKTILSLIKSKQNIKPSGIVFSSFSTILVSGFSMILLIIFIIFVIIRSIKKHRNNTKIQETYIEHSKLVDINIQEISDCCKISIDLTSVYNTKNSVDNDRSNKLINILQSINVELTNNNKNELTSKNSDSKVIEIIGKSEIILRISRNVLSDHSQINIPKHNIKNKTLNIVSNEDKISHDFEFEIENKENLQTYYYSLEQSCNDIHFTKYLIINDFIKKLKFDRKILIIYSNNLWKILDENNCYEGKEESLNRNPLLLREEKFIITNEKDLERCEINDKCFQQYIKDERITNNSSFKIKDIVYFVPDSVQKSFSFNLNH